MTELGHGVALAGYRIEALIGRGSTGSVYSAEDVALQRRVALKVLLPELARDERFRERFLRESRLAAALEHPHIVPIYAVGESDGVLFLAMRYVGGARPRRAARPRRPARPRTGVADLRAHRRARSTRRMRRPGPP